MEVVTAPTLQGKVTSVRNQECPGLNGIDCTGRGSCIGGKFVK